MKPGYGRARTNPGDGLGYGQWCAELLQHYFVVPRNNAKYGFPVRHLAVNDHELHLASGQRFQNPEAARSNFLEVFRHELREHPFQTAYKAERLSIDAPPQAIMPVIASCLVAAEYTSDENYRELFDEACGNARSNDTRTLPDLWEHVRDWLRACRNDDDPPYSVRELALPPRPATGWRNIYYSLHMTFPHRRDREVLENCVSDCAPDASVAEVIAAVARVEARFSSTFRAYFGEFRALSTHSPLHPFWHAVQNAWQARHAQEAAFAAIRLCAQVVSGDCHAYLLVNDRDAAPAGYSTIEAPALDANWRYVVVDTDGNHDGAVADLLSGQLSCGRLSRDAANGLVCFAEGGVRVYEWLEGTPRSGNGIALIRNDKFNVVDEMLRSRGGAFGSVGATRYGDWMLAQQVRFGTNDSERLPLVATQSGIEVVPGSGVPSGGGFVGKAELLPAIDCPYAARVDIRSVDTGGEYPASRDDAGRWRLPVVDLDGRWIVTGFDADGIVLGQLLLNLVGTPAHSEFQRPTDAQCARMLVEGGGRDLDGLDKDLPLAFDSNEDAIPEGAVYLGPVVGAWSKSRLPGYDWIADRRKRVVAFVGDPDSPTPPQPLILSKSAARFWRECFIQFTARTVGAASEEALRDYRAFARRNDLRRIQSNAQRPNAEAKVQVVDVAAHPGVELFQLGLAASSARQSGISEAEFFGLMELCFGPIDWRFKWFVLRAWLDAGVVELAMDARWPARRYFVRRPRLVFTDATRSEFVIAGLLVPAVVRRILTATGNRVALGSSLSAFAPRLLRGHAPSDVLEQLRRQENFEPSLVAEAPLSAVTSLPVIVDNDRCPDPHEWQDYPGRVWQWEAGYFAVTPDRPEVMFRLVQLPRLPDRYELVVNGALRWRTECRNWGFLAAHEARGSSPFLIEGASITARPTSGVHLPLRVARSLAFASGVTSGPVDQQGYSYIAPSASTAAEVAGRLLPMVSRKDTRSA